jgi:lipid-binding SYLF domain-containing protein
MYLAGPARFVVLLLLFLLLLALAPLRPAAAASAAEIDAAVAAALEQLHAEVPAARDLTGKAKGILVFPNVVKAGFVVGGAYGEGALRVGGRTVGYYNTVAASIGLQLGAQSRAEVILFMTDAALEQFRTSDGWEVGVDGSVALVRTGVAGEIDTTTVAEPVVGFIFGVQGLMANLNLEGAKISKLDK